MLWSSRAHTLDKCGQETVKRFARSTDFRCFVKVSACNDGKANCHQFEQNWLKQAERTVPMSKTVTTEAAGKIAQHGSSTLQRKSDSEPITWTAMRKAAQAYTRASVRTPPGSAPLLRCGISGFWSMHQLLLLTRRQGGPGWSGPRRMPLQGVCKPIRRRGLFFRRALL